MHSIKVILEKYNWKCPYILYLAVINNDIIVRSLLHLPGKIEKQWWMRLLKNGKKWMYKLLRVFLVLSFGGLASAGKSGLPQVLEWEIKIMLGARDYLQLQRGFIRKRGFSQNFRHPLWACREKHSVATQRLEDHSLQCELCPCWAPSRFSNGSVSLGSQFAPVKPFPHLLSAPKVEAQRQVNETIKHGGNPLIIVYHQRLVSG